ncbi:MAG: ABC transporter permease subunit [Chromatiales bacterium]|nr:ABC transporter permease subunit [Chromatiales bacterium]
MAVFFGAPLAMILRISVSESRFGQPPYSPLVSTAADGTHSLDLYGANYALLWQDGLYLDAWLSALGLAAFATLGCILIGVPMALGIVRAAPRLRFALLLAVILPFWTSFLIRVYAWIGILKPNGFANEFLIWLGLIDEPLELLHTNFAVVLGMVYAYLPFMVLPVYAVLARMDRSLGEAAADLGAGPTAVFWRVTVPLAMPGIIAGALLVFVPAVGEFVIPDLLGGPDTLMIGKVLWTEFFSNRDWPMASAVAVALLLALAVPVLIFERVRARDEGAA